MRSQASELIALASSTCVLAAMLFLGLAKGMLERVPFRHCPSCGRLVRAGGRCACR